VAIGYPAEKPLSTRKDLKTIVYLDKYGVYANI